MNKLIKALAPPPGWRWPAIVSSAVLVGLSIFVFYISRAQSYLSDEPETCVNCHVMAPQYATWKHSSHRENATCNDCHVPHNNVFNKYFFKAKDGLRHATMFTLRLEPQVIFIHEEGAEVVQNNCIRCHTDLITDDKLLANTKAIQAHRTDRKCWECHKEVPHGRVNSLSSVPNAQVPMPSSPVPSWLKKSINK